MNTIWVFSVSYTHLDVYKRQDLVSAGTAELKKRYGFIYVDRNNDGTGTMNRYKKDSYYWYKEVIKTNGESLR